MSRRDCHRCGGTGNEPTPTDLFKLGRAARVRRMERKLKLREAARRIDATAAYLCDLEYGRRAWGGKKARAYLKLLGMRP